MDEDRHAHEWLNSGRFHGTCGAATLAGLAGVALVAGFPVPLSGHPVVLVLLAAGIGYGTGLMVGRAVLGGSGVAAQQFYMPQAAGTYVAQHSHIDALEAKGNPAGAVDAWEKLAVAEPGNPWPLIRAGEIYMRALKDPSLALERFRVARDIPGIAVEHEMYASQKIIDLYLGPLGDPGRALVELRRFSERHAGTREARLALDALARLKSEQRGDAIRP